MQVQKTPEEIPSLHLRLILIPGTETPLNNKKKKKKPWGRGSIYFQTYHIIRFKHSFFNKTQKAYKETGNYGPFKGTK